MSRLILINDRVSKEKRKIYEHRIVSLGLFGIYMYVYSHRSYCHHANIIIQSLTNFRIKNYERRSIKMWDTLLICCN